MRSTYSLHHTESWSGRMSLPVRVPRAALLFAAIFAFGLAVGWIGTRPFAGSSQQTVTTDDYVGIVAQLYAHDHNLTLARERLTILGSPSGLVGQAVADGKLRDSSDQAAVQALSQALSDGTSGSTAASDQASTSDSSGGVSWLGPVLAFVLAFLLGAIVLLRTAGLSAPRFALPKLGAPRRAREDRPVAARGAPTVTRAEPESVRAPARSTLTLDPEIEDASPVVAPAPRRAEPVREARRSRTSSRAARLLSFQSCYRLGDDPYDEIHPIIDPVTGTLIAACGLNAALKHDAAHPSGYYAFAAWMQDYANGEALNAVGLVARSALQSEREQVEGWIERGQIDAVLVAERGTTTELQANDLKATVTVVDAGVVEDESHGYFEQLTVRFEVVPKLQLEEG